MEVTMKITIEWTYKIPRGGMETVFRSDQMEAGKALKMAEDIEKTGRIKNLLLIDPHGSTWTMKELKRYLKEIEEEPHNITVYFDGGYDLKTAVSGLGCAIYFEQNGKQKRLRRNVQAVGHKSNNEAEYAALHLSIIELELLNVHHMNVRFLGDSQVVINQMSGEWAVLEPNLLSFTDRIDAALKKLGIEAEYEHISRKMNGEADRLASQALQGIEIAAQVEYVLESD